MNLQNYKAMFLGLVAVFLWAAIPALVKLGSAQQDLSFLLVIRFFISSLIFFPIVRRVLRKSLKIPKKILLFLVLILTANYFFQGLAMQSLPASWYIVIFALNPLLAAFFVGLRFSPGVLGASLLPLAGTVLFVESGGGWTASPLALIYLILGMVTWVAFTVVLIRVQSELTDTEATALTQYSALLGCLIIWIFQSAPVNNLNQVELLSLLTLGLTTPLAYYGFSFALRKMPVFGVFSQYLEPVFGIAIGALVFGESINPLQGLGAVLIIWGTSFATRGSG